MINPKTKCLFLGHDIDEDITDGGYQVCQRCQMHEYFDSQEDINEGRLFHKYPFYIGFLFFIHKYWSKTKEFFQNICYKLLSKTQDTDDLPF